MSIHLESFDGVRRAPAPTNEPMSEYAPGSPERAEIKARLRAMASERIEIPLIIGGREVRTDRQARAVMPHHHGHVLADWHKAGREEALAAVEAAAAAHHDWANSSWAERAVVFLKAANLLATTWRATLNAATMLGQSKTIHEAEIDAAAETVDFLRFSPFLAQQLYEEQPLSDHSVWNQSDYRALEGFVFAVTPFNFTSIGANLPVAPALMGNTVIWKPASAAIPSAYYTLRLLEAAGLPPGVINFIPGDSGAISAVLLSHSELAGVHFTGSTAVFQSMWRTVGENVTTYRSYPRLVGETGGKDFILAHASADAEALAVAIVRGGYEYQGQKCSAVSRVYVPRSLWAEVRDRCVAMIDEIEVGDVRDFRNFMGAVIDRKAFDSITGYIEEARAKLRIVAGGGFNREVGYFIEPTLVESEDPRSRLMCEEIFGPVVTCHVYEDERWDETLRLVDSTSPYALTGAVFARDRAAIRAARDVLRWAAGNFYVNDKPTGAVVGRQPFGGSRASGTDDKAGSKLNLVRWVNARTVKENFSPPRDYRYPFMAEE
jgi:1-pyrroline-5-carboxylate dehydrogenase